MPGYRIPKLAILILSAVLLAAPARAAQVAALLPDDSEVVVTVNVKQLVDSPLFRKYALEFVKAELKKDQQAQKILDSLGFDPLKDVQTVVAAGAFETGPSDKGLFIFQGRFDTAKAHALADSVAQQQSEHLKIHKAGDARIYEVTAPKKEGGTQTWFVTLLDSSSVVASLSKAYVLEALDKLAGRKKSAVKKDVLDLLAKSDAKLSVSVVISSSALAKAPVGNDPDTKQLVEKIKTLTGGVNVTEEIKAEFVLGGKDADDAATMSKVLLAKLSQLKSLVTLVVNGKPELTPLQDIVDTFKVSSKGSDVILQGQAGKEAIEKTVELLSKLIKSGE